MNTLNFGLLFNLDITYLKESVVCTKWTQVVTYVSFTSFPDVEWKEDDKSWCDDCRNTHEALLYIDDRETVNAQWTLATSSDNVRNTDRMLWIGTYSRVNVRQVYTGL